MGALMKRIVCLVFLGALLTGCAGPRYFGTPINGVSTTDVVIIRNEATRPGFQQTMEDWLKKNSYPYVVVPDKSAFDPDKVNLEYVGHWAWDLALYLNNATISAYSKGQRVGIVDFRSPNSLNLNKFGNGAERVTYMMDILFGKITVDEANGLLRGDKPSTKQGN